MSVNDNNARLRRIGNDPRPVAKRDWLPILIQLTIVIMLAVLSVLAAVAVDRLQEQQRIDVNVELVPVDQRVTPPPALEG